jgi:hypothetical protein
VSKKFIPPRSGGSLLPLDPRGSDYENSRYFLALYRSLL